MNTLNSGTPSLRDHLTLPRSRACLSNGAPHLAVAAPAWLAGHIDAEVVTRYAARVDEWRLPAEQSKRRAFGAQIGADGWRILQAMNGEQAPNWLWHLPAAQALRRIWVQQYTLDPHGREVIWRDATTHGLPPGENDARLTV